MRTEFDLEKWLNNKSLKLKTRDGNPARIICTDRRGKYPVVALTQKTDADYELVDMYSKKGELNIGGKSEKDLFFDDGVELDEFQEEVKRIMYDYNDVTPSDNDVIYESEKLLKLSEKVYKK